MNARWHPQRLLRFSMGTMLLAMLAACIGIGSYTAGKQAGKRQRDAETFTSKIYPLADLAAQEPDKASRRRLVNGVADHLKTTVAPASWDRIDGDGQTGEIQEFSDNSRLVIHQSGAVHDQIESALTKFRDERTAAQFEQVVATIDSLAAEESDEPVVLVVFPRSDKLASWAVETSYDHLGRHLTTAWGTPSFSGQCFEQGFPDWSLAQSMTQWSKNCGDVYIALQDWPGRGRVVIGGWRRRE